MLGACICSRKIYFENVPYIYERTNDEHLLLNIITDIINIITAQMTVKKKK